MLQKNTQAFKPTAAPPVESPPDAEILERRSTNHSNIPHERSPRRPFHSCVIVDCLWVLSPPLSSGRCPDHRVAYFDYASQHACQGMRYKVRSIFCERSCPSMGSYPGIGRLCHLTDHSFITNPPFVFQANCNTAG